MTIKHDDGDLKEMAVLLSESIMSVDTDDRGKLLLYIGKHLKRNAQGYTGAMFEEMAEKYGYDKTKSELTEP